MTTHEVFNQAPPREGVDEFELHTVLREAVERWGTGTATAALHETGRLVGSAAFQRDAELANTREPELRAFDRWGDRIDEVEYDTSYHRVLGAAVAAGAHTSAWADPRPGANVDRAAQFSLFAQVEPGHACPVSMTHAAVPVLQQADADLQAEWMPRLLSREYHPALLGVAELEPGSWSLPRVPDHAATGGKASALFGMAMTEKQGGSDVRSNTTRAVDAGDGSHRLTGHKWFCSAPMSDAFFVLAQTDAGLGCFLVPRVLPDGSRNVFRIQRLKDKLGNRSNASSEIELDGTVGRLVGETGRGVRTILEMVARTRLDCVLGSAAGMRQAVAEAVWHVRHRAAFGRTLVDQPAMASVVADLALESEAATLTGMRLARAYDADATDATIAFRRLATAAAKFWVCKRGPGHAYEAMECLGGNGYTEAWPLARRYREQPVMAIWEGSGNVIALDVLRAIARDPGSADAFLAVVDEARGEHAVFDAYVDDTRRLLRALAADPADAEGSARRLAEQLALGLQGALMLQFAPSAAADAFVRTRLGGEGGALYGSLPAGTDAAAILARH